MNSSKGCLLDLITCVLGRQLQSSAAISIILLKLHESSFPHKTVKHKGLLGLDLPFSYVYPVLEYISLLSLSLVILVFKPPGC